MVSGSECTFSIAVITDALVRVGVSGWANVSFQAALAMDSQTRDRIERLHGVAKDTSLTFEEAKELGVLLYQTVMTQQPRQRFLMVCDEARRNKHTVRAELVVSETALPHLAALPWEFLAAPPNDGIGWFGAADYLSFVRRLDVDYVYRQPAPIPRTRPLKILLAVSAPKEDADGKKLGEVEYDDVKQALTALAESQPGRLDVTCVMTATRQAIHDALEKHEPDILHFIGHGRLDPLPSREVGQIAVDNGYGQGNWIDGDEFGRFFEVHRPSLVVLQSCESAQTPGSRAFYGVAHRVVQQGIPLVVAMQYRIENYVAAQFANVFYGKLVEGATVDRAVQAGRGELSRQPRAFNDTNHELYNGFATPVLFMQIPDGTLFAPAAQVDLVDRATDQAGLVAIQQQQASTALVQQAMSLASILGVGLREGAWPLDGVQRAYFSCAPDQPEFRDTMPTDSVGRYLTIALSRLPNAAVPADRLPLLLRFAYALGRQATNDALRNDIGTWIEETATALGILDVTRGLLTLPIPSERAVPPQTVSMSLVVKIRPLSDGRCVVEAWLMCDDPTRSRSLTNGAGASKQAVEPDGEPLDGEPLDGAPVDGESVADEPSEVWLKRNAAGRLVLDGLDNKLTGFLVETRGEYSAPGVSFTVELIVPDAWLSDDPAGWCFRQGDGLRQIGRAHHVIVRSLDRLYDGRMRSTWDAWAEKWDLFNGPADEHGANLIEVVERASDLNNDDLFERLEHADVACAAIMLDPVASAPPGQNPVGMLLSAGIPVAVWPADGNTIADREAYLQFVAGYPLRNLPARVFAARRGRDRDKLGALTLLWDDYDRMPPDLTQVMAGPSQEGG